MAEDRAVDALVPDPRSVAEQLDEVRAREAKDARGGGMGRTEVPRNPADTSQGQFLDPEEKDAPKTPG